MHPFADNQGRNWFSWGFFFFMLAKLKGWNQRSVKWSPSWHMISVPQSATPHLALNGLSWQLQGIIKVLLFLRKEVLKSRVIYKKVGVMLHRSMIRVLIQEFCEHITVAHFQNFISQPWRIEGLSGRDKTQQAEPAVEFFLFLSHTNGST